MKKTPLVEDLVRQGNVVVLVAPDNFNELEGIVFKSQIQKIQKELGEDIISVVLKENELAITLKRLKNTPDLIIAENKIIEQVIDILPESVKLTTYSLVMTRQQGNLSEFIKGIKRVKELEDGDKVLISEGCDNHLKEFEIGKLKIQEWLNHFAKKKLQIDFSNGCGYPDNLSDYSLIVQCNGCSISQKLFSSKIKQAKLMEIPIVNYGVLASFLNHTFPRTILPFSEAVAEWGRERFDYK